MSRRVVFTEEEKKEDIKDVETMLRDNPSLSCQEIALELGRSSSYISNIRNYLDKEDILTKEELEKIALEKIDEKNREFDKDVLELIKNGKNKSQIRKKLHVGYKTVAESYERLSKVLDLSEYLTFEERIEQERLAKIKDYVNDGTGAKYYNQIVKATDIPFAAVKKLVQILISNESIEEDSVINIYDYEKIRKRNEEIYTLTDNNVPVSEIAIKYELTPSSVYRIIKARNQKTPSRFRIQKKDYDIKEPDDSLTKLEKSIIEYLKKGLSHTYMCKRENIEQSALMKIVSSLKERKYITQTIINEAREERRKYYLNTIEKLLKDAMYPKEIYNRINKNWEELTIGTIYKFIDILIDNGKITEEEIARIREEHNIKEMDSKVSSLVKKGYSITEIVATDESYFTESQVKESRKRVIASENITKEQLKKWQQQRRLEKQNEIHKKDEKIIWNYVKEFGYDDKDIAPLIDASATYVGNRRRAYQQRHNISTEKYCLIKDKGVLKRQKKETKQRKLIECFIKAKKLYQKEYEQSLPKLNTKQRYFNLFVNLSDLGIYSFTKEDIDILGFTVLYEEEFFTEENIKYVIKLYLSIKEEHEALKFLNNYINYEDVEKNYEFIEQMQKLLKSYC